MKSILVIEDNNDIRENLAELLELQGFVILTANHGKQGLDLIMAQKPDLVICDITMPELDGFEVLNLIRKNKQMASVPFIFLTARSEKTDRERGLAEGALHYIIKPFTEDQLMAAVSTIFEVGQD